jgi:hypothetical protein
LNIKKGITFSRAVIVCLSGIAENSDLNIVAFSVQKSIIFNQKFDFSVTT